MALRLVFNYPTTSPVPVEAGGSLTVKVSPVGADAMGISVTLENLNTKDMQPTAIPPNPVTPAPLSGAPFSFKFTGIVPGDPYTATAMGTSMSGSVSISTTFTMARSLSSKPPAPKKN